jgi:nicotinamide phosphoribosyltransferase
VSDSYDLFNAIDNIWGMELRQEVIDSGAVVVIRPDSGDPVLTPVKAVTALAEKFGTTTNSKGFKVLNNVRVIQGDGVTQVSIHHIFDRLYSVGFSADNIAFGMGGALLQGVNRDTQRFAMKTSAVCVDGKWRNVSKDPATDPGKRSKEGMLSLVEIQGKLATVQQRPEYTWEDKLNLVFANGTLTHEYSFAEIRERSERAL